jgi:hypothetical protein
MPEHQPITLKYDHYTFANRVVVCGPTPACSMPSYIRAEYLGIGGSEKPTVLDATQPLRASVGLAGGKIIDCINQRTTQHTCADFILDRRESPGKRPDRRAVFIEGTYQNADTALAAKQTAERLAPPGPVHA